MQTWKNKDNAHFYDSIPLNLLPDFAVQGGLNTGCDLDQIEPYIIKAKSIFEIGAGYGRVIANLISRNYRGRLVGVERSHRFCQLLKSQFENNATIIEADINFLEITEEFDLVLWLWSGICDFSQNEQLLILKKILSYVKPSGMLVLDSLLPTLKPTNAASKHGQCYTIPGNNNNNLCVYTPYPEEIDDYASQIGFISVERLPYKTATNRERMLYLLRKISK